MLISMIIDASVLHQQFCFLTIDTFNFWEIKVFDILSLAHTRTHARTSFRTHTKSSSSSKRTFLSPIINGCRNCERAGETGGGGGGWGANWPTLLYLSLHAAIISTRWGLLALKATTRGIGKFLHLIRGICTNSQMYSLQLWSDDKTTT